MQAWPLFCTRVSGKRDMWEVKVFRDDLVAHLYTLEVVEKRKEYIYFFLIHIFFS